MGEWRGRRWWILGALVVIVTVVGLVGHRVYFSSTSDALRRAEALTFRRMLIAQREEQGSYRFFFATNRAAEDPDAPLEARFGTRRDTVLRFGSFDVGIEPSLGLGMLVNPSDWFQNREIQLQETRELAPDAFVSELREVVGQTPDRSLLVVIHGFREAFPSALRKTAFLAHVLDLNIPIVVFDWPGDQGSSLQGFRSAREVARESAGDLAAFIALISSGVAPDRLSVIANSMGGEVIVDALRLLNEQPPGEPGRKLVDQVLLTAPDVDYDEFNAGFRAALERLVRQTTVYVSSNDRALLASRLLNRGRRLGESSLRTLTTERRTSVIERDPNLDPVTVVDVTPVNRTRNFHNFSLETPEFYDDLFLRLGNPQVPKSRLLYPVETPDGTVYWILTRGR
jgi:esterase/lipase superfamily enzyme